MKKLHFGRSMIEMLGVLAIVGILSIGGMSMYRKAILNYRLGQTQHWIEIVRFIIAEACANGNTNGCFFGQGQEAYQQRSNYVCSHGGEFLCPKGFSSWAGSLRTPLKENVLLLYMNDFDYLRIYLEGLDKRTCEAVIDYNWHGLKIIANYATSNFVTVNNGRKHLTQSQKDVLKAGCPFPSHLILIFDLKS